MTAIRFPTAEIIDELKRRLAERGKGQVACNYVVASEYLDYVEKLLREQKEEQHAAAR